MPTGCYNRVGSCRVHVNYHGCGGGGSLYGPQHVGFAEWGEANDIIIVYPQASWGEGNYEGCWDWWGITGDMFDTHEGLQLQVVLAMINELAAGKVSHFEANTTDTHAAPNHLKKNGTRHLRVRTKGA